MYDIIAKNPLFQGIDIKDLPYMLNCLNSKKQKYESDAFIFLAHESSPKIGIILSGRAQVIKENHAGDRMIIGKLETGDIFGETFACMGLDTIPVSVLATDPCKVLFLDAASLIKTCDKTCDFHHKLIANLLAIMAKKNTLLNAKMSYLTHKTIRGRVLAYLDDQAEKARSDKFTIPYNRNELADYLCVDRSALSRELRKMKQEGLLDYKSKTFLLKS